MSSLSPLSSDPPSELNILGHDGNSLSMDGTQIGVLEQSHQVGLASLLQGHHGRTLEPEVGLEILGNLPHEPLEWQLTNEQFRGLLVSPNFPECHRARPVPVRFLDSSCCWGRLTSSLGGKLLPGGFSSSRFAGSLLSTSHYPLR